MDYHFSKDLKVVKSTYQVRKMKIIIFVGIFAVLVQHISCLSIESCPCSCCFDPDQNYCVDYNNGRCEWQRIQGGGSCQQGELI